MNEAEHTTAETLLLEAKPSWWHFFWHLFFFWLIVPLIVAIWQKRALVLRIYDNRISLEKGVLSKSYTEIFIKDIRTVYVSQGAFQRMCGIGDIKIATAGTLGYELVTCGLPEPIKIRDLIIAKGRECLE